MPARARCVCLVLTIVLVLDDVTDGVHALTKTACMKPVGNQTITIIHDLHLKSLQPTGAQQAINLNSIVTLSESVVNAVGNELHQTPHAMLFFSTHGLASRVSSGFL